MLGAVPLMSLRCLQPAPPQGSQWQAAVFRQSCHTMQRLYARLSGQTALSEMTTMTVKATLNPCRESPV